MNVWIFVISAMFSPVIEPLGIVAPTVELPAAEASVSPASIDDMRYHGLEQMLAKLDADRSAP